MKTHLRFLHLEDESNDAELIQLLLQREQFTCSRTLVVNRRDYEEALRIGGFDLILSDYTIPGFDGITALRLAVEQRPEIPFIFISGSIGEDLAIEALKSGATDYVLKDRLTRLAPSVRRALREIEERDERREAEAVLHASQERINLLLKQLPFVLYMASGHDSYRLTWVSQQAVAITGFSEAELLADRKLWMARIHPEDMDRVLNDLATLLHRGRVTTDYRWQTADGRWRRFIDQQVVVRADDGTIRDVMGSWHDVTDLG
ncbi:MAG: PAS domain-containing protein [Planctomycetota bacterium]